MPRNVGKITREASPGPEMDEQEFVDAMNELGDDAARWRWLMANLSTALQWPIERMTRFELQMFVDRERGA
jgi:hypothetical protein